MGNIPSQSPMAKYSKTWKLNTVCTSVQLCNLHRIIVFQAVPSQRFEIYLNISLILHIFSLLAKQTPQTDGSGFRQHKFLVQIVQNVIYNCPLFGLCPILRVMTEIELENHVSDTRSVV